MRIRFLGRYANGAAAALFTIFCGISLVRGALALALFCALVAALCAFNVYVMEKAAALWSEEEWLKAEVRKAQLRRKMVGLRGDTPESVGRNYGL